jgi:glycine cleavage system H lipoate-binding protein
VNDDPYGAAWLIEVEPTAAGEVDGLLDADMYVKLLG